MWYNWCCCWVGHSVGCSHVVSTEIRPPWNILGRRQAAEGAEPNRAILGFRHQENTSSKERCALKFQELWSLKSHLCSRVFQAPNSCRRSLLRPPSSLRRRHSSLVGTGSIFQHPGVFDFTLSSFRLHPDCQATNGAARLDQISLSKAARKRRPRGGERSAAAISGKKLYCLETFRELK